MLFFDKQAVKFRQEFKLHVFVGRPGVYFKVVKEGLIDIGDELRLVASEPVRFSVSDLFLLSDRSELSASRVEEILSIKALPPEWREQFESLL